MNLQTLQLFTNYLIFVCENNFYSVYTNLKPRQPTNRNFVDVAKAIGLDVLDFKIDGILDIFDNLKNVTQSVRKKVVLYF